MTTMQIDEAVEVRCDREPKPRARLARATRGGAEARADTAGRARTGTRQ